MVEHIIDISVLHDAAVLGWLMTAFGPKRPQHRPQVVLKEETRDGV